MQLHGIHVDEKELLITAGAQSAIDLVFKTFTRPGDRVVLESPTYSRVIGQCELYDTQVLSIPMDEEGMIPEELERVCRRENPAMIYSIPNFHNPTGITSSHSRREEILRICERQRIPLIEDGFEEEMKYFGREVLPIKSMDRHGTVVYLGTFSKVLFPGVRIGWVAADRGAVARLAAVQKYSHLCGPPADQAALAQFCEKGLYDVHIKKMHRVYRSRMQTALEALEKHMPTGDVSWTRPAGGYTLWLRISRPGLEEERFLEACAARGVMLAPGRYFFTGSQGDLYFRISVGTVDAEHIERGIRLIAETIEEL
jgi:GntR family transcriptional regulator/MocR family aminotransferase